MWPTVNDITLPVISQINPKNATFAKKSAKMGRPEMRI